MKLQIIQIDKIIFQGEVSRIKAQSPDGHFEILEGHAPMIAVLRPGELRCEEIQAAGQSRPQTFNLSGGIMKIEPKEVTVLAE